MLEYAFVFPIAVLISTIAMMFGIGGAIMFMPFFVLVMAIPAATAAAIGLFIEFFGFSSGVIGFARRELIDYKKALQLIKYSAPLAIIGGLVAHQIPSSLLLGLLAVLLLALALMTVRNHSFLHNNHRCEFPKNTRATRSEWQSALIPATGGFLAGSTGSGLGELTDYTLMNNERMSGAKAAGTSVFVVAVTALAGVGTHIYALTRGLPDWQQLIGIVIFAVPAVLIGAQIGVWLSDKLSETLRVRLTASLFFALSILVILTL